MPRVGNTVGGKYVLQELIGEGAMGSVWRAVHQTLGRPFAVKFLKPYGMDAERLEARFLQEARLAASIQHRFVVSIMDYGLTDEATPYMVMEYLQGESLASRLAHAPNLPVRELVRILAQSLVGLEAVHQAGVIHRDLKPENIMLVPEAGGEIPKLVDFGISRSEGAVENLKPSNLTAPGVALGTPWYMSPEQVKSLPMDRRTDIYSMGVMLYETMTGRFPFDAPAVHDLMRAIAGGGADSALSVRPEIGPFVSGIVERAMAVHPIQRFGSASEMAAALFSVMTQLSETLTCPLRQTESRTSPHRLIARPIIPGEAEVSADLLGVTATGSIPRPPAGFWRAWWQHRTYWWAGAGVAAMLIGVFAIGRDRGTHERMQGTVNGIGAPSSEAAVNQVPTSTVGAATPGPAAQGPAAVPIPAATGGGTTEQALAMPLPSHTKSPSKHKAIALRSRGKQHHPAARGVHWGGHHRRNEPPDAFTTPGF